MITFILELNDLALKKTVRKILFFLKKKKHVVNIQHFEISALDSRNSEMISFQDLWWLAICFQAAFANNWWGKLVTLIEFCFWRYTCKSKISSKKKIILGFLKMTRKNNFLEMKRNYSFKKILFLLNKKYSRLFIFLCVGVELEINSFLSFPFSLFYIFCISISTDC